MALDIVAAQRGIPGAFEQALSGYRMGTEDRLLREQQAAAQAQAAQQAERKRQLQEALGGVRTTSDINNLILQFPELEEQFSSVRDFMSEEQKKNTINQMIPVFSALKNNRPDVAKQLLETQLEAAENSGNQRVADGTRLTLKQIEMNPDSAFTATGISLKSLMGDDFKEFLDQPEERKSYEDVYGIRRYTDTGEPVFAGETPEEAMAARKAGATQVNIGQSEIGTIPQGFELFTDPETGARRLQPIAGGPAAAEAKAQEERKAATARGREIAGSIVSQDIDRVLEIIEGSPITTTGAIGAMISKIGGTEAGDASALLDTIRANVGFDKLQAMRDASPTGGALGQVSEFENRLLQSVLGSLEQKQSKDQLLFNLKRLKETYLDIIHGPGNRPSQKVKLPDISQLTDEQIDNLSEEELDRLLAQ